MVWLLDGNVLTALAIDSHIHHLRALRWFYARPRNFATCMITEGTLLRIHMMSAADPTAEAAWQTLRLLSNVQGHEFWSDGFTYQTVAFGLLRGHRQVTDAWLAELARRRGGKIATMDSGFAHAHPDVSEFIAEI